MALRAPDRRAQEEVDRAPVSYALALRPTAYRQAGKRLLDIAIGLPLLVLAAPLILVLAILVVATTGWPPFYAARRVGKDGRIFRMWKLRTMVNGADLAPYRWREVAPGLAQVYFTSFKLKDDTRVTKLGRVLRRTSLDELPQLWNVVRGDMSLVGPRPVVEEEAEQYGRNKAVFLSVRPGITGAWQTSGRNDIDYPERIHVELEYVLNMSLKRDLQLLCRTLRVIVHPNGI